MFYPYLLVYWLFLNNSFKLIKHCSLLTAHGVKDEQFHGKPIVFAFHINDVEIVHVVKIKSYVLR